MGRWIYHGGRISEGVYPKEEREGVIPLSDDTPVRRVDAFYQGGTAGFFDSKTLLKQLLTLITLGFYPVYRHWCYRYLAHRTMLGGIFI